MEKVIMAPQKTEEKEQTKKEELLGSDEDEEEFEDALNEEEFAKGFANGEKFMKAESDSDLDENDPEEGKEQ